MRCRVAAPRHEQRANHHPTLEGTMALIQRVQDILLKPKETWPAIAQEPATVASIYNNYVIYLAAIPAIATFIGLSLIGVGGFGLGFRIPIVTGLVNLVIGYVLSLVIVFVMALIVDALAPTFGGTKNQIAALKVVAYASTAGFVGGIFSLLPSLAILGLLVSLYSVYLLYTGLPVLMRNPPEKAGAYTAVVVVCGIVLGILTAVVSSAVLPMRGMGGVAGAGDMTIKTPGGEITIDSAKMEDMARKMEEAGKRMEAAQQSGDGAAAGKAMGEMMSAAGAMAGGGGVPIPAQDLKALLPETIGDLKRESYEAQGGQAMGFAGSSAKGSYAAGDRRVNLSITDAGGLAGLAALAGWANMTVDRETNTEIEKVYKQGSRTVREEFRKDGSHGEVTVILGNGVIVEADGDQVDLAGLKKIVEGIDLGKLEGMQRPAK
jgi:hypothetical protein